MTPAGADICDGDLVRLAKAGDQVAFRLLIERYQPMARARAARLCRDQHEVDDIVQEAFLQAFVSLERLRDPDRFAGWLGGIVVNVYRAFQRRSPMTLLADWPERLHPVSADGPPSADDLDRAEALRAAVADLPPGQQRAVTMFYFADRPARQIAGSAGAAKASLHKARRRLREHIAAHRPDLIPRREKLMTSVRIAHAEPRPSRTRTSHVLVVLADDAGRRALPVWLGVHDGRSLWRLLDRPGQPGETRDDLSPGELTAPEEITVRLLDAAGATVTGVDVDELGPGVTAARADLTTADGTRQVTVRLADGLALAAAADAPVRAAGRLMDRLATPVHGDDLLGPFLAREPTPEGQAADRQAADRQAAGQPAARRARRHRYEPRNLAFADGLDRWELGGSFRHEASGSHWRDYSAAADGGTASLFSAVAEPEGLAYLGQQIFADDYRGRAVTFRGDLRAEDLSGRGGLFLRVVSEARLPPARLTAQGARADPDNHIAAVAPSVDWAPQEVTAEVPGDAAIITFGIFLNGRGRVELRHAELARSPDHNA